MDELEAVDNARELFLVQVVLPSADHQRADVMQLLNHQLALPHGLAVQDALALEERV